MSARIYLFVLLWLWSAVLNAQKVGVVLSGGGAKGLAHIGVLKALEENNIPIDYVVGTSMGAVVAGFYAAGYSPSEMEKIALSPDFVRWVKGTGVENQLFFYTKNQPDASGFTLNLSIDSGKTTALKSFRVNDSELNMALCKMLSPAAAAARYDFDSLMVPFRALASDIFTQSTIVLDSGVLSDAIRASFTVPIFYRPIKINSKYYFDGGVYNNFPVDVMLAEFNPGVVIGVNVSNNSFESYPYGKDERLIDNPISYLLTSKSDPSKMRDSDIYLPVDMERYSALDFDKGSALIALGYKTTVDKLQEINQKITDRRSSQDLYSLRTGFKNKFFPLRFNSVSVEGISKKREWFTNEYIRHKKDSLSLSEIDNIYLNFLNEPTLDGLNPKMIYDSLSGKYRFETQVRYRHRLQLDAGLLVSNRNVDNLYLGANYRRISNFAYESRANLYLGRFYSSGYFGTRFTMPLNLRHYFEPHIVYNSWNYNRTGDFTLGDQPLTYIIRSDLHSGLNVCLAPGKKNRLLAGAYYFYNRDEYANRDKILTDEVADKTTFEGMKYAISFEQNTLNRKQYANKGLRMNAALNVWNGVENYYPGTTSGDTNANRNEHQIGRLSASAEKYFKYQNISLGYSAEAAYSPQFMFSNYRSTLMYMPAYFPIQDSRSIFMPTFRAFSYLAGGFKTIVSLRKNVDLRTEMYVFKPFATVEEGEWSKAVLTDKNLTTVRTAGCVTLVYHSTVGPLALSMNYYDDPTNRLGIFAHFGYVIYNRSSLD